jgi:hypothetical protein
MATINGHARIDVVDTLSQIRPICGNTFLHSVFSQYLTLSARKIAENLEGMDHLENVGIARIMKMTLILKI